MSLKPVVLFSFIGVLSLISHEVSAQDSGTLKGVVKNQKDTGLSLVNIIVKGSVKGSSTDEDGKYIIKDISAGRHEIKVSSIGYKSVTETIDIKAHQTQNLDFQLEKLSTALDAITIKGGNLNKQRSAATVNTISAEKIKKLHITKPDQILREVPGVEISDYNQGGTASTFSMRGFGSGGHGGDVAVTIDGVSLNESEGHADGYTDMNMLIPLNIAKVDVFKGPSSVLFGNFARGGALSFETRKGGEYQDIALKGGSYETFDAQAAIGTPLELDNGKAIKSNFAVQLYRTKGFTENSENLRGNLNGRLAYDLSDNTDVALTLKGHASKWDASGFIPGNSDVDGGDQFHKGDRFKQAKNAENDGGKKSFVSERIDINHTINEDLRLLVYGYSVQQSFTRFQKFGIDEGGQSENANGRNVFSAGTSLNGDDAIGSIDVDWTAGVEYYNEFTDKKTWNTANRVRQENAPNQKRRFRVQSISAFAQGEFNISKYFRPSIGLRYDVYDGSLNLRDPGSTPSDSDLNSEAHVSPKLGFTSTLFSGFDFRFSASNGFSLPQGVIRYDSDTDIDPSQIWQYEVGVNYDEIKWLTVDLAGYIMDTSSEINEITPGSGEFINSGKTQRRGIELKAEISPFSRFHFDGSFSYVDTEIKDNPNKDLEGKELNGIPSSTTNLNIDYTLKSGLGLRYKFRNVGEYATGADNAFYYGGYNKSDAEIFYDFQLAKNDQNLRLYVQLNNMFDQKYATTVFDSFGPEGGQSYAPAPGRNFMVGLNFNL